MHANRPNNGFRTNSEKFVQQDVKVTGIFNSHITHSGAKVYLKVDLNRSREILFEKSKIPVVSASTILVCSWSEIPAPAMLFK